MIIPAILVSRFFSCSSLTFAPSEGLLPLKPGLHCLPFPLSHATSPRMPLPQNKSCFSASQEPPPTCFPGCPMLMTIAANNALSQWDYYFLRKKISLYWNCPWPRSSWPAHENWKWCVLDGYFFLFFFYCTVPLRRTALSANADILSRAWSREVLGLFF